MIWGRSGSPGAARPAGPARTPAPAAAVPPGGCLRPGPSAHRITPATGQGLRCGQRPPHDHYESSRTMMMNRWPSLCRRAPQYHDWHWSRLRGPPRVSRSFGAGPRRVLGVDWPGGCTGGSVTGTRSATGSTAAWIAAITRVMRADGRWPAQRRPRRLLELAVVAHGRVDLLAQEAGLAIGFHGQDVDAPMYLQNPAQLCIRAGAEHLRPSRAGSKRAAARGRHVETRPRSPDSCDARTGIWQPPRPEPSAQANKTAAPGCCRTSEAARSRHGSQHLTISTCRSLLQSAPAFDTVARTLCRVARQHNRGYRWTASPCPRPEAYQLRMVIRSH